ncbi:HAD family hydrolase [Microbacterium sp. No. 7]|uniref:HAD family hydrolase n=1 Tax=Microbacterium sp. No. 7 TaxID=1714373 RepID=UPI0006D21B70|nr:HAD family phosphatase [Microbacterium sp. No. 7]ALJ20231.1 hydrolase [Microbacterium sp. No. 7]
MTSALPAAVLWDMDGTVVDTEPLWMAAEVALVARHGGRWTHEQALGMVGLGLDDAAAILQRVGVEMDRDAIVQHLTDEVTTALRDGGVHFRPGARELLAALREAGVRTALVTMSLRSMAEAMVERLPDGSFDVIVAGDDATRPKPYPDPYLQACAALGIDPAAAVAIEDSPTGVRAAVAAGVVTVGVPLMVPLDDAGADTLWPTLEGRTPADLGRVHAERRTRP